MKVQNCNSENLTYRFGIFPNLRVSSGRTDVIASTMAPKTGHAVVFAVVFALHFALAPAYTLVHNFNYTNWYSSFMFENVSSFFEICLLAS